MGERRIGLIVPSSNTVMEDEFRRVLPPDISLHVARVRLKRVNLSELSRLREAAVGAAAALADAEVDVILFGCTSGSLVKGKGYDVEISREIEESTGIQAVTTATAVVEALRVLEVERLCVATPYTDEVNAREKRFLEEHGFKVLRIIGLGIESNVEIGRVPPQITRELALRAFSNGADGLFISCTNLKAIGMISALERTLGKPVICSNQASMWAVLRRLRWKGALKGYGSLLEMLAIS